MLVVAVNAYNFRTLEVERQEDKEFEASLDYIGRLKLT